MRRGLAILRPEPGNAATAARAAAMGFAVVRLPLFAIHPVAWEPPPIEAADALLLTSANAVRDAGAGLAALVALPVVTVGKATAAAARAAGLTVAVIGAGDSAAAIRAADARGLRRLLHLAGRETAAASGVAMVRTVYASEPLPLPPGALLGLAGTVALVHSPRAGRQLDRLATRDRLDRASVRVAAISPAAARAAGAGWAACAAAAVPDEVTLLALAGDLAIDRPGPDGDKAA